MTAATLKRIHSVLLWPTVTLADLTRRIPAVRRFDEWCNEKERQWRRRRNAGLVAALAEAGLHDSAVRLDETTL